MIAKTANDRMLLRLTISSGIDDDMQNVPDRRNPRPTAPKSRAILTAFGIEKAEIAEQTRTKYQLVATIVTDADTLSP